ncbi:hypothetical protein CWE07_01045 [Aliidiomarina maris]|uniref:Uncharacterized protein n=1 Tax=Aliidiomarina maris TaxID=531312 RepID=A0A327XBH5_9GAMM|nr:hypothetical protein B0I24_101219 [Aliidiomarina maris]RUO28422.1 hypothetical protein CWE07_01045 [Aliidiomarina maris]
MHILLMLALVIGGLALFNFSSVLGVLVVGLGLCCFLLGSERWREEQTALFFMVGLIGAAAILGIGFIRWLLSL